MEILKINKTTKVALVDDEDYNRCLWYNWRTQGPNRTQVISTTRMVGQKQFIRLANYIMRDHKNMYDHIDRNQLNNQKNNLRVATHSQNMANRGKYGTSSKYRGVHWSEQNKAWHAKLSFKGTTIHIGYFKTEEEAAVAYNISAKKYFDEFANINLF